MVKKNRPAKKEVIGSASVISRSKQVEGKTRESAERYRTILNQMQDSYYEVDLAGNFIFVSDSFCVNIGYAREELVGNNYRLITTDKEIGPVFKAFNQVYRTGERNKGFINEVTRKDGGVTYFESSIALLKNEQGEKIGFCCVGRDVTERKKIEEASQKTENAYRLLADHMSDVVWMMDLDLNITWLSPSSMKVRGYSLDELRALPLDRQLTPESLEKAIHMFGKWTHLEKEGLTPEPQGAISTELEFTCKDGSTVWLECATQFTRDQQGKATGILIEGRNITERKKAEKAARENEEKYRIVVENALEAISISVDAKLVFANRRMAQLSGYSQEELISRSITEFIHPDDLEMVIDLQLRRWKGENVPNIYSFRIVDKAGNIQWREVSTVLITWEGKPATLNFMTDIMDRKRLEEERQLVAKLEAIGVLAGGIAHNFNNILTSILGNISLARAEAAPGSDLSESLEQAEKASLRAKDLTLQLLTFSKGGGPVKTIASLTELLKDTVISALGDSNVKCQFSIPDGLWHAEIDARQVSQVIHNLVINARQAMPAGGSIEISAENIALSETHGPGKGMPIKAGDYIRVAITDHGTGIPAEHLEKIFNPFFTTKINAIGLGVATSFSIARQHGGHLSVESELGAGSTFYLYLPASAPKQTKKKATKAAGKARILVMDDEKGVREIAGRMLRHIGYEDIEFAEHGAEAIKLYKASMESGNPFTVAILDLTIPGGHGGEWTIRELHKLDPGVKAIISSGYIDDPVMAEFSEYGFSGMVAKPYTLDELRKALQDVIG